VHYMYRRSSLAQKRQHSKDDALILESDTKMNILPGGVVTTY
jgi:hypothetical protein